MSDILESVAQDQIADALIANPAEAMQHAEPSEETAAASPIQEETQAPTVESPDFSQEEPEADELPVQQEKQFPGDVYDRYAQRYNIPAQFMGDPAVQQLLHDKINADIHIRNQQAAENLRENEPEVAAHPVEDPRKAQQQHFAALEQVLQTRTDPQVAKQFHADFLRVFGVPDSEIAKIPQQQSMAFTQVASKYMLNLVGTFFDDFLAPRLTQHLMQAFPGFDRMYERYYHADAWENVRNADPKLAGLPAYGTRAFGEAMRKAAESVPGFDQLRFEGPDGGPLSPQETAERKYAMLARIASGQNTDAQLIQQAAAAGARNARRADVRRSAGNLGSGHSRAGTPGRSGRFETNSDIFDEEALALYQGEHGRL